MGDAGIFPVKGERDGRAPLQAALAAPPWSRLRLEPSLEAAYVARRRSVTVGNIRAHWIPVVAVIAIIAAITYALGIVDEAMSGLVTFGYAVVFLAIGIVVLGAKVEAAEAHIDKLLVLAAFVTLGGMLGGTVIAPAGSALRSMAEYGVIFITIAVCTISGLSLIQAVVTVLAAIAAFLLVSAASFVFSGSLDGLGLPAVFTPLLHGFTPDWSRFPYYAGGSAIIAAVMGLSHDLRERTVFLQAQLLVLEKKELDQLAGELTLISREDALTGLANRRHFDEVFTREWAACLREGIAMNVLFIDVDYFKRYNDHYGHQAGDACLVQVAHALGAQALRGADFVARYGGEEFIAMFPRTNTGGLAAIAGRIIAAVDALQMPHAASDVCPHVTVSVGVAALTPSTGDAPERLVQLADAALYRAKQAGRHRYVVAGAE